MTTGMAMALDDLDKADKYIEGLKQQNRDLRAALEAIQSIAKDPGHRTQRTQLQTCRFFDELILPTIDKALGKAK